MLLLEIRNVPGRMLFKPCQIVLCQLLAQGPLQAISCKRSIPRRDASFAFHNQASMKTHAVARSGAQTAIWSATQAPSFHPQTIGFSSSSASIRANASSVMTS